MLTRFVELDARKADGLSVTLWLDRSRNLPIVRVLDDQDGVDFCLEPPPDQALFAFHHPFVVAEYLPRRTLFEVWGREDSPPDGITAVAA